MIKNTYINCFNFKREVIQEVIQKEHLRLIFVISRTMPIILFCI
jgi:hypothetical protein